MKRSLFAAFTILAVSAVTACDRREDPSVDPASKVSSSPPGEIVDPGPTASAQADHVTQPRTSDAQARPTCEADGTCDDTAAPAVDR